MMREQRMMRWFAGSAMWVSCLSAWSAGAVGPNWIEQWGIRWTFDRALSPVDANDTYRWGTYANGDYWVVGPVRLIGIDPNSREVEGRIVNGAMINPIPGGPQGYDSAAHGWTPSLNAALGVSAACPLTIGVADAPVKSLVSTISTAAVPDKPSEPRLRGASVLTIVATAPAPDAFRPPYCGETKFGEIRMADIDRGCLGSLAPVSGTPPLAESERAFERVWLDHGTNYPGEVMHPLDNMPWYGRNMARTASIAALQLNLGYPPAVKEPLLIRFLQYGIDVSGVIACPEAREIWSGNGGIANGRKLAGVFAARVFHHPAMIAQHARSGQYLYAVSGYGPGSPPPDYIHFGNEDDQVFYVSQADVEATNGPLWHPDPNSARQIPYRAADIGLPEWGIRHAADPWYSNNWWPTSYRGVSGCTMPGSALAGHIMGLKSIWNNPAFFDYCDRYMATIADGTIYEGKGWQWGSNGIDLDEKSRFVWNLWHACRENYPPVWKAPTGSRGEIIWSWGDQRLYKTSLTGGTNIAAGGSHSLALTAGGTVLGWGNDAFGQASVPEGLNVAAVAAGGWHSLALLADGSLRGWGDNSLGQAAVPGGADFAAVSAGESHSLALRTDGTLVGWGDDTHGQSTVPGGNVFAAISAGGYHNLALRTDGTLAAWGENTCGQTAVPDGNDFTAVAAGGSHSLVLTTGGTLLGWGDDTCGQASVPDGNDFVAIAAGDFHSLALRSDGTLLGWGDDTYGQATVPDGNDFIAIAAGGTHSLAMQSDGSIVGWGNNASGQATPPGDVGFIDVEAGGHHSLALRADGSLAGWGNNAFGQASVPPGDDFVAIAAGDWHSLALRADGSLVGWGNNDYGQAAVPSGDDYVAIAAGGYHSLALRKDGSIIGWGDDTFGQATVPAGVGFAVVAAGGGHSLALAGDCGYVLGGDLNRDCRVDLADLATLAAHWLVDCQVTPWDPACVPR